MRKFLAALGLSTALAAAAALPLATQANAAMAYSGGGVADLQRHVAPIQNVQLSFFWGDAEWCWYPFGWRGPGWYWCGYEWDNGYGWGGPYGWNGWYIAPYYRSGRGWQEWHRHHHHHYPEHRHMGPGPGHPGAWTGPSHPRYFKPVGPGAGKPWMGHPHHVMTMGPGGVRWPGGPGHAPNMFQGHAPHMMMGPMHGPGGGGGHAGGGSVWQKR